MNENGAVLNGFGPFLMRKKWGGGASARFLRRHTLESRRHKVGGKKVTFKKALRQKAESGEEDSRAEAQRRGGTKGKKNRAEGGRRGEPGQGTKWVGDAPNRERTAVTGFPAGTHDRRFFLDSVGPTCYYGITLER